MSDNLKYTKEHEWVQIDGDVVSLGITEYAKNALGELVYIELPEVGDDVSKGDDFAVVESVKVASEVYSPVNGQVVEVNESLQDNPDNLAGSPDTSWIVKIKISDTSELEELMNASSYDDYIKGLD